MSPTVVVAVVTEVIPSNADGNAIGLFYRGMLNGGTIAGTIEVEGDLTFQISGNPITAYETAIVDVLVGKAAELGYSIGRSSVFFPVYKRGV